MQTINPAYHVEILGINLIGMEAENIAYTEGNSLPWLQDVAGQDVRSSWQASDRDVYILDPMNRVYSVYNLYEHDLDVAANRDALRALFLEAAGWLDDDNDSLCDYWEKLHFLNLSHGPADDPDGDGKDNFTEYSFGTRPLDASSCSSIQPMVVEQGGERFLAVEIARRMGSQVMYSEESCPDLATWGDPGATIILDEPLRNLFDGTGTGRVKFRTASPTTGRPPWFFRISALPGSPP